MGTDAWVQDYFDYIHSRNISSGVSDWDHYIGEIKR